MSDDTNIVENENKLNSPQINPDTSSLKQYWIFFSGQLFSLFGSSVVQFAIIWWLTVTSEVRYPGQTGLILSLASIAGFAPFVLTSLFAGVLVDRWNRKLVIGVADFVQALVTAVLLLAFFINKATIPVVLVILAVRAIAQGFHSPATNAIIPLMVPKEQFSKVNSYQYLFNSAINLVGPVVGAVLLEFVGVENIAYILAIDMISFAVAVLPLIMIHIPDITKAKRESKEKNSFSEEFKEGIMFIYNAKGLLPLLLTFTILNILVTPVFMLLPLVAIADNLLMGDATTLAIIMAGSQGGTILGSFIMTRFKPFKTNPRGVISGQFLIYMGIIIMGIGAFLGNVWIVTVGSFLNGLSLPLANIHSQNIWLSVVPNELQGRVMSVRQTIAWILIPVAQLIGGYLSDIVGILPIFFVGSIAGLIILAYSWFGTSFPRVEAILGIEEDQPQLSIEPTDISKNPIITDN